MYRSPVKGGLADYFDFLVVFFAVVFLALVTSFLLLVLFCFFSATFLVLFADFGFSSLVLDEAADFFAVLDFLVLLALGDADFVLFSSLVFDSFFAFSFVALAAFLLTFLSVDESADFADFFTFSSLSFALDGADFLRSFSVDF